MRTRGKITACGHIDRRVYANGMCRNCYTMKRYWSDPVFREKKMAYGRKASIAWLDRKMKQDPNFNAERQKKFRQDHPEAFNMLMARFYWKKLTPKQKQELKRKFP